MLDLTKIKKLVIYFLTTASLTNCVDKKLDEQWNVAEINATVSQDSIFKKLDKEPEQFSAIDDYNPLRKRTTDLEYLRDPKPNLKDDKYSRRNNCRAYFLHSDTLSINIGLGDGFGGYGFIINYKNKKFYTEPYFSTDIIIEGEVGPTYKIAYQKLILNNSSYAFGDSVYGYIDFKSIERDSKNKTKEHFGKGFFRTRITKF